MKATGVEPPLPNRPALRATNRNSLARLRRAAASSDSYLPFCERGAVAPLSHIPPGHAGSERSSLPLSSLVQHSAARVQSKLPCAPGSAGLQTGIAARRAAKLTLPRSLKFRRSSRGPCAKGAVAPLSHIPPISRSANGVRCRQFSACAPGWCEGQGTPTSGRHSPPQAGGRQSANPVDGAARGTAHPRATLPRPLRREVAMGAAPRTARPRRRLTACGETQAAFARRCIPAEPLRFAPFCVAFRSKYTRYSSLTRLVSRAPPRARRSPGFHHRLSKPRVPAGVRRRWPLSPPSARSEGHLDRSEHRSSYSRSYLPHFDAPYVAQGLTFRLADSVPRSVIDRWRGEIGLSEVLRTDEARYQELLRRVARYEDAG